MDKIDNIRKFISGDFGNATIYGKVIDGNISLDIKLEGIPDKSWEYDKIDNTLKADIDNKIELFNYFLSNYLENNFLNTVNYFVNDTKHKNKNIFEIEGSRNLKIILDNDFLALLSDNFLEKINQKRRKDILECVNEFDNECLKIHNMDCKIINSSFCGGRYGSYFVYSALAVNVDGNSVIPDSEKEFINNMFKLLINKENVDIEYFYNLKTIIDSELLNQNDNNQSNILKNISLRLGEKYYNYLDIRLNSKNYLTIHDLETLLLFKDFLNNYISEYEKEIGKKERRDR